MAAKNIFEIVESARQSGDAKINEYVKEKTGQYSPNLSATPSTSKSDLEKIIDFITSNWQLCLIGLTALILLLQD